MKHCNKCKLDKEDSEFSVKAIWCKPCNKAYQKEYRQKLKSQIKPEIIEKCCSTCNNIKAMSEFNKDIMAKDGFCNQCKACIKLYRQRTFDHRKEYRQEYYKDLLSKERETVSHKICSMCNIEKPASEFWKSKHNPCGLYSSCIECKSKSEKSPERMSVRLKNQKEWKKNNLEKARKWHNNWERAKEKKQI